VKEQGKLNIHNILEIVLKLLPKIIKISSCYSQNYSLSKLACFLRHSVETYLYDSDAIKRWTFDAILSAQIGLRACVTSLQLVQSTPCVDSSTRLLFAWRSCSRSPMLVFYLLVERLQWCPSSLPHQHPQQY